MQNFTRRELICAGAMGCFLPTTAWAHKVKLPERFEPQLVNTRRGDWVKGDVHVVPDDFFLYFMLEDGMAIRYGVGVGRKGLYEPGEFTVARKAKWPWWRPTNAMIRREPRKYAKYKDGLKGGPNNPLGPARSISTMPRDAIPIFAFMERTPRRQLGLPCRMDARG